MIPNQVDIVEVMSSGFEDSFDMSLDENSLVHLMEVLTKMYSDPALAVIREYSANGLDSHVKAGQTRPIEVSLPSRWNQNFVVRDFGVGMDVEYMRTVYSKYGASDKRDSNDFIGGFGIGSKAGLAYTHSFTVTAWKDGKRSRAIVSKNEAGAGKFDIIDVVDSDEPNGVEISIAVKGDTQEFARKARDFFAFWERGTVLLDGDEPKYREGIAVGDNLTYVRSGNYWQKQDSYVVVGSVPYKIDMDKVRGGNRLYEAGIGVTLRVGVGEVAIAPSREALTYTPGTIDVLSNAVKNLWDTIVQAELDKIAAAPNYKEAYALLSGIGHPFSSDDRFKNYVYKGAQYQQRIQAPHKHLYFDWQDRGFVDDRGYMDLNGTLGRTEMIVTGFTGKIISTVLKRKMRQYADDNSLSADNIVIVDKDIDNLWLSDIHRVSLDTIKAVKLPAGHYVANKKVPTFDVYTKDGYKSVTEVKGKKILYVSPADARRNDRWGTTSRLNLPLLAEKLDATIVSLNRNRWDKFLRENPKAKPLATAVNEEIKRLVDLSSDFDASNLDYYTNQFLKRVPLSDILDADLVQVAQACRSGQTDKHFTEATVLHKEATRGMLNVETPQRKANRAVEVINRYPLIKHGADHMSHLVLYVNVVFEQEISA